MSKLFLLLPGFLLLLSCTEENLTEKESESICTDTLTYSPARKKNHSVLYAAHDLILATDSLKIQHDLDSIFRGASSDNFYFLNDPDFSFEVTDFLGQIQIVTDSSLKVIRVNFPGVDSYEHSVTDTFYVEFVNKILKKYGCKLRNYAKNLKFKPVQHTDTVFYSPILDNGMFISEGDFFWSIREKQDFHILSLSYFGQGDFDFKRENELTLSYYFTSFTACGQFYLDSNGKHNPNIKPCVRFRPIGKKKTRESFSLCN